MIGALFGLIGAAIIGVSDSIARVTGRRTQLLLLTTALFTLPLAPVLAYMAVADAWPPFDVRNWALTAASGVCNAIGLVLLFAAIARGPIAVASPAASLFSILLVAMNVIAGEPFRLWHGIGAALSFAGLILLARPERGSAAIEGESASELALTALLAVGAAFFIALRMFTAQETAEGMGSLGAAAFSRAVAGLCTGTAYLVWRVSGGRFTPQSTPGVRWHPPVWTLILLQSALEISAIFVFLVGGEIAGGDRIAAVVGYAAFAAFSPIAARIIWGERIGRRRALCIALTVAGAAAAALA